MNGAPESNKGKKLNWRKLNTILWTCIIILIILLLLTTTVTVMTIGNFLPENTNIFFLVPKEPSFELGDGEGAWSADNQLDIFKSEYKNGKGEIIIQSSNGDDVIAPGAETEYSFELNNNGNIALDYAMDVSFKFTVEGISISLEKLPMQARIMRNDGTYLVGDGEWTPIGEMSVARDEGTLGVASYVGYTLEVKWDLESGDDTYDTYLGDLSCMREVLLTLEISTYAEESENPNAIGGTVDEDKRDDVKVGGSIRWFPYIIVILLILLLIAAIIWILTLKKRKEEEAVETVTGETPPV